MNPVHLELRNVSKSVQRKVNKNRIKTQILSGIDLEVQRGELITVMGPSGSGKTTLLRLINRLSEADSGAILLNGRDIKDYDPLELRRRAGMVFQVPLVFRGSVRDSLTLGMRLWGNYVDIGALARDTGIPENLLDADAEQLSVGEKQRVCIARALANQPEILLLDEPTSSLDAATAEKIEGLLLNMRKERKLTMIWVTHDIDQAGRIDGRRFMLSGGRLVENHV
ncbi:MAG: phosphate ABC transporter ATP-binding protein [Candidatus Methanoperedens sp.]|nr:phosphate ABC transporter ATP-binding protein [Candidatus Methanoperedens sp.]